MKKINAAAVANGESLHAHQHNDDVFITYTHPSSDGSVQVQASMAVHADLFNRFIDALINARNQPLTEKEGSTFEISFGQ